jgi:hypothetical protein
MATGNAEKVHLWEVVTGKERRRFVGHGGGVLALRFAHDGRRIVSGSRDYTALIWDLTGLHQRGRLPTRKLSPAELNDCWAALAGGDASQAYQAIWALVTSPATALPFLKERLQPIPPVDAGQIKQLVRDLDSNRFAEREKARVQLEKLGELAEAMLEAALEPRPSLEVLRRIERLLEKLRKEPPAADTLRRLRAVEVLEQMAMSPARELLAELARGTPEASLTQEAQAALQRLAKQPVVAR